MPRRSSLPKSIQEVVGPGAIDDVQVIACPKDMGERVELVFAMLDVDYAQCFLTDNNARLICYCPGKWRIGKETGAIHWEILKATETGYRMIHFRDLPQVGTQTYTLKPHDRLIQRTTHVLSHLGGTWRPTKMASHYDRIYC